MKSHRHAPVFSLLLALSLAVLTGCSTPGSRIKKNPELFNSLDPEQQARIRIGKVEIGFSSEMVYLALGDPDRRYTRKTETGTSTVWAYVDHEVRRERQRVQGTFRVRDGHGISRRVTDSVLVDVDRHIEYDAKRIELINDKVTAIETIEGAPGYF